MKNATVLLSADELILSGEVYFPDDCGQPRPAVCISHGIPAVPYNPSERGGYPDLAAKFCEAGFVSLIFNFRGCGPSQGNIDMVGWTHDLTAAVDFLHMLPEVDMKKIYLLGSSGGAAVSVCVAAKDSRVAAVGLLACPAEFDFLQIGFSPESIVEQFRSIGIIRDADFPQSMEEWLSGFKQVTPLHYVDKIAPRPLLIIHGDRDETVPFDHAERLYLQAGEPKKMTIIPGGGHRLRLDARAVDVSLGWLREQCNHGNEMN
jgi:putative redox protein